jgi:CBS domain-containing protein
LEQQLCVLIVTIGRRLIQRSISIFHGTHMNAFELCQRHVVTIRRHEEIATAAWMMRERGVGCLVVVDPLDDTGGWHPVGLLSEREIVVNVIARDCDPRTVVIEDVMISQPITVRGDSAVKDVLQRMRASGARRVLVVDEHDRLSGILSRNDIFEHFTHRAPYPVPAPRQALRLVESSFRPAR